MRAWNFCPQCSEDLKNPTDVAAIPPDHEEFIMQYRKSRPVSTQELEQMHREYAEKRRGERKGRW